MECEVTLPKHVLHILPCEKVYGVEIVQPAR